MTVNFENMEMGVSVVIVTYNGTQRLEETLKHLAFQQDIDCKWEVLLIDNNSTDGTAQFAVDNWGKYQNKNILRVIHEPKSGTMYARYSGIINAKYRYLLFCDDDNWLHERYIKLAFEKIKNNNKIAAIGGQGVPQFEKGVIPPEWIHKYIHFLGCGPQGKIDGDITNLKGCLYTAGAILDRVWLEKLYNSGFKSVLTGRNSNKLVAGEDTELTYALKIIGGELHYYSAMSFKHFIPERRLSWDYIKAISKAMGYSNIILAPYIGKSKNRIFEITIAILMIFKYYFINLMNFRKQGIISGVILNMFYGKLDGLLRHKKMTDTIIVWKKRILHERNSFF